MRALLSTTSRKLFTQYLKFQILKLIIQDCSSRNFPRCVKGYSQRCLSKLFLPDVRTFLEMLTSVVDEGLCVDGVITDAASIYTILVSRMALHEIETNRNSHG